MEAISDLQEANRCIRELAALSLFPAIWSGGQKDQIRESLADGLHSSLRSEIVYVRDGSGDGCNAPQTTIRYRNGPVSEALRQQLGEAVDGILRRGADDLVPFAHDGKELLLAVLSLGPEHESGVIAIGSSRPGFPTITDRIVMNVGVNQAIIAFRGCKQVAALRRSEGNLRDFFENATVGLHWVNSEGTIVWANKTELDLLGYDSEEYIGHHVAEFHADGCVIEDILARLTRGESLHEYEARLRAKDGSIRHVLINSNVLFEDGKFIHTRCFTRDITGRKEAENALADAAEQRRLALEAASLGSWDYRFDTGKVFWDERCRAMWGLSEGSHLDYEHVLERLHPEDQAPIRQAVDAALAGKENGRYRVEFRVVWPDGSEHWIASRGQVYFEGEGGQRRPVRFTGIVREFTDEKRTQAVVERNEKELRVLADSIPQLAWMARPDGHIFWYNRGWYEYTGTTLEQMEGWGWQKVHDPAMLPLVMEKWQHSIQTGEAFEMQFPLRGADGTFRWFLTRVNPVRDGNGQVERWFGTNTDVEEVKRTQEKLRDETRVLELLNKSGTAIASKLDLQSIVQTVTDAATELSGARFGAFFYSVIGKEGEALLLYTLSGAPREAFEKFGLPRNTPVFNPTFRGEGVIRSADITKDPRYGKMAPHHGMPQGHLPVRSYMAVPVVSRSGEVIGGLFFGHPEPDVFTERTERIIVGVAAQAATAIDNARLYDAAQKEISERTQAEAALARQIQLTNCRAEISASLALNDNVKAVLQRCAESLSRHLNAAVAGIWTVNATENTLELQGRAGIYAEPNPKIDRVRFGQFKIGLTAQTRVPHLTNDLINDPHLSDPVWAKKGRLVSFAGYPLIAEPHVVGVVAIFSREPLPGEVLQELSLIASGLAQWIHRVRVEEEFRKGAGRLHLALKAGKLGDWSWEAKTDLVTLGPRAAEIFGLPPGGSTTWSKLRGILHPDDRERARLAVEEALSRRSDYDIEYRVQGPSFSGEHWVAARGQGIYSDDGTILGMTGVVQDITEQKRASEVLEGLVQERTAKLKETITELEAFSYSISHDMRSPLRAMQGYAEALVEGYHKRLDETGARYLERIQRGALRLDMLIQDVLAYSKVAKDEVALKEVDLEVIVKDVVENYPQIQVHGSRITVCQPLPKVVGHEGYLTQIFSNLLGNAVKFVSPGALPQVRVWAETEGPMVRVWIEDTGIGIHSSHHRDIFQIFGRVYSEKKFEGTGIGLAIVKKAAERLGGSVGVLSELAKGSRFWVTLKRSL